MRKVVIFLILLAFSLAFYSCSKEPEFPDENPWEFYGDWTMHLGIRVYGSNTNVFVVKNIYYVLIDKDKKLMYVLLTNEFVSYGILYPSLGYGGREGVGLIQIFEDVGHPSHLVLIEETLKKNNITNVIFSFLVRIDISKDGNDTTLIFAGFDESITNIGAIAYGLGMYEGVFDWNGKVTNVHSIIPIAGYSRILSASGDSIMCDMAVGDTNINISIAAGEGRRVPSRTNFVTNIYITF